MKILGMSRQINLQGYFFAEVHDLGRCIGCMLCAITCPDLAITVHGNAVHYRFFDYFPSPSSSSGSGSGAGDPAVKAVPESRR